MVSSNVSSIVVMWENTFVLNSVLIRYELVDDKKFLYAGLKTQYIIRRTASMG